MAVNIVEEVPPQRAGRSVARNASVYFIAQVTSWFVTFVAVSIIPRTLGERITGQIAVAESITYTMVALFSIGIEMHIVSEVGRNRMAAEKLLRAAVGMRLVLIIPAVLISAVFYLIMRTDHNQARIGILATVGLIPMLMLGPPRAVLIGMEYAGRVAFADFLGALAPLLAIPVLLPGRPIPYLLVIMCMLYVSTALRYYWASRKVSILPSFHLDEWWRLARGGLPFFSNDLILKLYGASSIFIVRHFVDLESVGELSQGGKLFGTFLFVPTALGTALLPAISRTAHTDPEQFRRMQARVLTLLTVIGLPVAILVFALAHPLCNILYSAKKFDGLPLVLQIMAFAVIPVYIVTTMYQFLVAQGRGGVWSYFLLGTVALNFGFGWILTPITFSRLHNGAAGAALANLLAEIISSIAAILLLKANPFLDGNGGRMFRGFCAAAIMSVTVWLTRGYFIVIPAVVGVMTYIIFAKLLKVVSPEDEERMLHVFDKIRGRLGLSARH